MRPEACPDLDRPAGSAYGLFLDNIRRVWLDMGKTDHERLTIGAPDDPIDCYVIALHADGTRHAPPDGGRRFRAPVGFLKGRTRRSSDVPPHFRT
ncbi:hypothetical protein [Sphingomonas sp.]|uniref:hypothetical protein n=1 Tax=Sphingomonas sp. TaxID=28214 RepID=UPI0035BBC58A